MFPGMNMNPRQMKQAMKKMGVTQDELDATEVIIRLPDRDLVIENPEVAKVNMMGQESYQITGDVVERQRNTAPSIDEEDVMTVMEQAGASHDESVDAITDAKGDLAQAIMNLKAEDK